MEKDLKKLNQVSERVLYTDPVADYKLAMLTELAKFPTAIGLAGIQIGLAKQIIAMRFKEDIKFYLNPEIIEQRGSVIDTEQCLSLDREVMVRRHDSVLVVHCDDPTGAWCSGLLSRVFQHEIDHCNGKTLLDREYKPALIGRNAPCPCGSGKKFKHCCGNK